MRYFLSTLFVFCFSQTILAVTFTSTIHSIDLGKNREPLLIKFDSSHVGFVERSNVHLVQALLSVRLDNPTIKVVLDSNANIISVENLKSVEKDEPLENISLLNAPYEPTIVKDYNTASKIMRKMRRDYRSAGQCFNRAHIWAYEEFMRSGLKSMKLFLFFTNRYIRNYRFHWWFHVTPMVYVGKDSRTLDRRYTSAPNYTKPWTNIFIRSKRTCPTVTLFNSYANNQEKQDCYLLPASMYHVTPRDIEKRDLTGVEKEEFIERDIRRAYKDAFIKPR